MRKKKIFIDGIYYPYGTTMKGKDKNSQKYISEFSSGGKFRIPGNDPHGTFRIDSTKLKQLAEMINYPGLITYINDYSYKNLLTGEGFLVLSPFSTKKPWIDPIYSNTGGVKRNIPLDINETVTKTLKINIMGSAPDGKIEIRRYSLAGFFRIPDEIQELFSDVDKKDLEYIKSNYNKVKDSVEKATENITKIKKRIKFINSILCGDFESIMSHLEEQDPPAINPEYKKQEIIDTYRKNRQYFFDHFEDFIEDHWLSTDDDNSPLQRFLNGYFLYLYTGDGICARRDDTNVFLRLDTLKDELKEQLIIALKEELSYQEKILGDWMLIRSRSLLTATNYRDIQVTILGMNDKLKIANLISKRHEFVNYDSIEAISVEKLKKLRKYSYFITKECGVVVATTDNFYKLEIPTDMYDRYPDFDSITGRLKKQFDQYSTGMRGIEDDYILMRVVNKEMPNDKNTAGCDPVYEKQARKRKSIEKQLNYLSRVPEENKDLYAKIDWWMKNTFTSHENTYGNVCQELVE